MTATARTSTAPTAEAAGTDDLVGALLTGSRVLVGVSARSLADVEESVTLSQFRTLVVLRAHGVSTLKRLAQRLGVNASTTVRAVDRLVAAGLVERREGAPDRREVAIGLTDAGRRMVDRVTARRRAAITRIVRKMPVEHRAALVEALVAFAEAADEPRASTDAATELGW